MVRVRARLCVLCMCVHIPAHAVVCMWGSENKFLESVFFFPPRGVQGLNLGRPFSAEPSRWPLTIEILAKEDRNRTVPLRVCLFSLS